MKVQDYEDLCDTDTAERIHKLCGIYARRYANRLALKGFDSEDLEEEVVCRILESEYKTMTGKELVRNARRDIFNIVRPRKKDSFWYQMTPGADVEDDYGEDSLP